jgi:cytochrome P450
VSAATSADALLLEILLRDHGAAGPYQAYRRLRDEQPVLMTDSGVLVLSRYADCDAALRNRCLGKADESLGFRLSQVPEELQRRAMHRFRRTMLFQNPPDHTRLRRLVTDAFNTQHVAEMRSSVITWIDRLLDDMAAAVDVDIITALALPLPVNVIGDLLGLPAGDRAAAAPLIRDLVAPLEPSADAAAISRAAEAEDLLANHFGQLLDEKRRHPKDDLLSRLASARGQDILEEDECIGTAILLFAAGFETTTNLIGNGLAALLRHPQQLETLRDHPGLAANAVEELLRYDAPVQTNGRTVLQPTVIAGVSLEPGQVVLTLLGSANRDPDRYIEPEALDLKRHKPAPMSFGSGIHFCLGAQLARMEGQELFPRLVSRFQNLSPAGDPTWRSGLSFRGLQSLPVRVR